MDRAVEAKTFQTPDGVDTQLGCFGLLVGTLKRRDKNPCCQRNQFFLRPTQFLLKYMPNGLGQFTGQIECLEPFNWLKK
jgi:hypothetical protein